MMLFPSSAMILDSYSSKWERAVAWSSVLTVGAIGFLSQTRLDLVLVLITFVIWGMVSYKRSPASTATLFIAALAACTCLTLALAGGVAGGVADNAVSFFGGIAHRLQEDTRSGQLVAFIQSVDLQELVLGRGALATWDWGRVNWNGGTDVGYLTLAFVGGIPLLVGFIWVHVIPASRQLRLGVHHSEFYLAVPPLLYGILMLSSALPSLDVGYYVVLICVGCCACA
jgi:hypothetical protein